MVILNLSPTGVTTFSGGVHMMRLLEPTAEETSNDIVKLQGINRWIIERLSNEDITTVTQIAYCDPIRLIMRSNLTFNFVTDCMNQALAVIYT
jgi:hypothetical protein